MQRGDEIGATKKIFLCSLLINSVNRDYYGRAGVEVSELLSKGEKIKKVKSALVFVLFGFHFIRTWLVRTVFSALFTASHMSGCMSCSGHMLGN
jgi:hypothetical protein